MPICLRVPISCGPQQLVVRRCSFHGGRGSSSSLNCTRVQATWDRGTRSSRVYARASELIEIAKRFCYFIGPPRFGTAFACKARCRELLSGVSLANGWSVLRVTVREHRSTVWESTCRDKWTQYYTALGELLREFETVSKSREYSRASRIMNNRKSVVEKWNYWTNFSFNLNYYIILYDIIII